MTTTEQLIGITGQYNEIVRRVGNGSLEPVAVRRALQAIIEGKFPQIRDGQPPTWWVTPQFQLERAHKLWPGTVLPRPPMEFTPQTKSEVLLLHVPDTFDSLWDKVAAPTGYTKRRMEDVKLNNQDRRLVPAKHLYDKPVWLAFDPEHGKGQRPDSLWNEPTIAASEVFSAVIQFPDWCLSWFEGASAPNLSGYQANCNTDWWSHVPYLDRRDGEHLLVLGFEWAEDPDDRWSSPSVREC